MAIRPKSQIKVTLEHPDGLFPIKVLLTCRPETQEQFDAVVAAAGGPCAFDYHSGDTAHADIGTDAKLLLTAPERAQRYVPPPLPPSIQALKDACKS